MIGGVLKGEQQHYKLSSQRSLEAVATETKHRRAVTCRRIIIICALLFILTFIGVVLGTIVYSKVAAQHAEEKAEESAYAAVTPEESSRAGGVRGMGGGKGPIDSSALASLRDLQDMHSEGLRILESLRAVTFELEGIPQLKRINRIERSGETYILYFDKGEADRMAFTENTFVYLDKDGKSFILSPQRGQARR